MTTALPRGQSVIFLLVWFNFYDQMAMLPLVSPRAAALGATAFVVGLTVAGYSVTSALGNATAGPLIDRYGRWPFIAGGFLLMSLSAALHALVVTPAGLLGMRLVHGLVGGAVVPAAFALLGDVAGLEQRGRQMALSGAAIALAAVIAPPLSGALQDRFGFTGAVLALALVLAVAAVVTRLLLPPIEAAAARRTAASRSAAQGRAALPWATLWPAYAGAFTLMFGQGVLYYALPLKARALGMPGFATGILFTAFAAGSLVSFLSPLNRLGDRRGRVYPLVWGLGLMALANLGLAVGSAFAPLIGVQALLGLGFGLVFPALNALVVDATDVGNRGKAFGIYYAVFSAGAITGPTASGALAGLLSPFCVAALVLAAAFVVAAVRGQPRPGRGRGSPDAG